MRAVTDLLLLSVFTDHYNGYSPMSMYGEPYGGGGSHYLPTSSARHLYPLPLSTMHSPYYSYSPSSPMVSMAYHNYYREPNVLNRLLNRARYGTGSYFGNPYMHTRVTFDPQGNRIWPEGNYVSSVKDLWKTSTDP
jgi:hypothetical protein